MMSKLAIPDLITLPDLQEHTHAMVRHFEWDKINKEKVFLLFIEEVGELAKAIRKMDHLAEEKAKGDPSLQERRDNLAEEMADVLSYLADLANRYGVDLSEAYRKKMTENLNREWAKG
jgi:NTP pyrophosphatase (non-canonical NTP hydrolase)